MSTLDTLAFLTAVGIACGSCGDPCESPFGALPPYRVNYRTASLIDWSPGTSNGVMTSYGSLVVLTYDDAELGPTTVQVTLKPRW